MENLKLTYTGVATILLGFIFFATGILLLINTATTPVTEVNPWIFNIAGILSTLAGLVLMISRDEAS